MPDKYTHGHHESVLRSHRWRTAENSAAYLLPHLRSGMALLDVGCGPGNITCDLADRVAPGPVVGLDVSTEVVTAAATDAEERGPANVSFRTGDLYGLEFDDDAFDVVHAHQVLQHLTDPVAALQELRRVVRPDGVVAVRDSDYAAMTWGPDEPRLDRWLELYHQVTARNGAEADAGRRLLGWAQQAGFAAIEVSSSNWTYADPETRAWWSGVWADRVGLADSALHRQAIEYGLATPDELADLADGWRSWAEADDGVFVVVHVEVLARG
ncbi:MAG TPA: methyltransferase domain-containing protein [Acidimicrobiales bacterium]